MMTLPTLDHFTADILARLPAASGWEVQKFMVTSPAVLAAALEWTDDPSRDAIWFEFCWPPFPAMIEATDFGGRRVIVRVHRIEAVETPYVANTAWAKVDDVIVVSPDMRKRVLSAAPELNFVSRVHVVSNGVDVDRFSGAVNWNRFRIGWCGLMTLRKNPTLALQILFKLRAIDQRYQMRFCGMAGDAFAGEMFWYSAERLGLSGAIAWDGNIAQSDMPGWHAANGMLLHTSFHESFGYAIAEAACSGCDIALLDHPGAETTWPATTIFRSIDEAVDMVLNAAPGRWRTFVINHHSLDAQIRKLSEIIADVSAPSAYEASGLVMPDLITSAI
ncbi:glycosyltransferase family 4 protein [Acidiphilium sp. PA]|uniref:glycosyltransferase family 4 protein n=1 Tax=Acidiphilium sp. PA TaxID=2871705 RepID=UPI002243C53D|nr:glycosyltransferase family 4 protein [Acidiphilium sp. PA]MCW8308949.1 glycosyltransferase family 4 protein [Acidiphilium sp. PA]